MKLAEALMERADLQRRLAQIKSRLTGNAQYQEGEKPAEQPQELLHEYERTALALQRYVVAINEANHKVMLPNGTNMMAALAERDRLKDQHAMLTALADAATPEQQRYSRSEIRMIAAVDVKAVRKQADDAARQYRELDVLVQQANWQYDVDLAE